MLSLLLLLVFVSASLPLDRPKIDSHHGDPSTAIVEAFRETLTAIGDLGGEAVQSDGICLMDP